MGASIAKNTSGGGTTFPGAAVASPIRDAKEGGNGAASPKNPVKAGGGDFLPGSGSPGHFVQVTAPQDYKKSGNGQQ